MNFIHELAPNQSAIALGVDISTILEPHQSTELRASRRADKTIRARKLHFVGGQSYVANAKGTEPSDSLSQLDSVGGLPWRSTGFEIDRGRK